MDYFVYLSVAKTSMLFAQLSESELREISHELGFDFKLLKASRTTKKLPASTQYEQVKLVEKQVRATETVGCFDSDSLWIEGEIDAKLVELDKGSIAFVGSETNTVFSLGGSANHLISGNNPVSANAQASYLPDIAHWIAALDLHLPELLIEGSLADTHETMSKQMGQGFNGWINVIDQAFTRSSAKVMRLRHFSRRLGQGYDRQTDKNYVLGTPLYVALA